MKLQIDTTAKVIKIEGDVNLGELVKTLDTYFPDGSWKEFTLETNTIIHNWSNPIVIQPSVPYRYWPWYQSIPSWPGYNEVWCNTGGAQGLGAINNCTVNNALSPINQLSGRSSEGLLMGSNFKDGVFNIGE